MKPRKRKNPAPKVTGDNYFDAAHALYWYMSDYAPIRNSYAIAQTLAYTPGAIERGLNTDEYYEAQDFYSALEDKEVDPMDLAKAIERAYNETHDNPKRRSKKKTAKKAAKKTAKKAAKKTAKRRSIRI